jgi:hypothetical protein
MKTCFLTMLALTACAAVGCATPGPSGPAVDEATSQGLKATLSVDRQFVHPGDSLHVTLTARNLTPHPMEITARSGARLLVTVWKYESIKGWQRIDQYPQAATFQLVPWKLAPFEQHTLDMTLPVSAGWPSNEMLRLTAELNGRPDARPHVLVKVLSPE